ncbi:DUF4149 domain-containing protein [Pseudomonadota bacterium]
MPEQLLHRGERLILSIWVGGLLSIGYIAVPILFNVLDSRQMAGQVAGQMFFAMNVMGFVCGGLLLALASYLKQGVWIKECRVQILLVMVLNLIVAAFVLQPMMQELKAGGLVVGSQEAKAFGLMHGVSSVLYLINSVLGVWLVVLARAVKTR